MVSLMSNKESILTGVNKELICETRMIHIMYCGCKQSCHDLQWCEDTFESRCVEKDMSRLSHISCMHTVVERVVFDVVIL